MNTNDLRKLESKVKSLHDYWRGLNPEERRKAVVEFLDAQQRTSRQSAIVILVFGIVALAATVFFWHNQSHRSLMSSLGIVGGVLVAGLGFRFLQLNRVKSYHKLFSDDFSDEDILAWLKEHEEVNRRFVERWNGWGKYLVFVVGGAWIIMLSIDATKELASSALFSALTVLFLGLAIFVIVISYPSIRSRGKRRS